MSKKATISNKDTTLFVLVTISIVLGCFSIFTFLKANNLKSDFITLNTKSDYVTAVKFECAENPSDECTKELDRAEKDLRDFIDTIK